MAGDPAHKQRPSRPGRAPAHDEWYAVTSGGGSALRISPGLVVGELESGALALNDPEAANQWVEFVLSDAGEPWATIVTREKSLLLDGVTRMRHQLTVGSAVKLPHNTLYISRDIRMPAQTGQVIEVVPREVPGRPQDLVGPGWAEALAAVREPAAGNPAVESPEPIDAGEPAEAPGRAEPIGDWRPPPPLDAAAPSAPTAAEERMFSSRPTHRERRSQRRRRILVMLGALAIGALTLAGVVAVLLSAGSPPQNRLDDLPPSAFDDPAARVPPEPLIEPQPSPEDAARLSAVESEALTDAARPPAPVETPIPPQADPDVEVLPPMDAAAVDSERPVDSPAVDSPPAADDVESAPVPSGEIARDEPARLPATESPVEPAREADRAAERAARAPASTRPDWRLVRARELLEAGYITYPPRDNAVAYLERLLAVEPNNAQALALLVTCANELIDAAIRAHDQGLDYEARNTLEEVLGFDPENAQANRLWREWVMAAR